MANSSNSEHLQFIHDRIVNVYGESENVDFLIRLRKIISELKPKIVLDNSGSMPPSPKDPIYFNTEIGKIQRLFDENTLIPTWTVKYEDPNVGNKGEALYMTVSAKDEDDAKTQALACTDFSKHITPSFYNPRYLTTYKATGNYKIGEVRHFEGDPRL